MSLLSHIVPTRLTHRIGLIGRSMSRLRASMPRKVGNMHVVSVTPTISGQRKNRPCSNAYSLETAL